ncbi:SDR family oxidoreductase [Chloroflexi bacterium TSY]|nr:SDR family oxidoreductase [Chloroflexi bacterium TSY]
MNNQPSLQNKLLQDKIAIVTGAGRGIGQAIALGFAKEGAQIVCVARTQSELDETVDRIIATGGQAIAIQADVSQPEQVAQMTDRSVAHFGGIDILILNAGAQLDRNMVEESDLDGWQRTIEVNLFGPYYCARAAIPHMKARGAGKIIMVGSGMGHKGGPSSSAYSCSKAGLWMLTRILAQEVWQDNISVNELIPGPVETAMTNNPDSRTGRAFTTGGEWVKQPQDVVPLALFLATQPNIGPTAQSFSLMRRDT